MSDDLYFESPYLNDDAFEWVKGNLHCHSNRSDGAHPPQVVVQQYAEKGFDFLAISDHSTPSDYSGIDDCGLILLDGNELNSSSHDLLQIGASPIPPPYPGSQAMIDRLETAGGLAIICHPNWLEAFDYYSFEDLVRLRGYCGIEIFNGTCIESIGSEWALNKWDRILAIRPNIWGFASDDAHCEIGMGRGWNVAQVRERTPEALLNALQAGQFYASTGMEIEYIKCTGGIIEVSAPGADSIVIIGEFGKRFASFQGDLAHWDINMHESRDRGNLGGYVRVECYGPKQTRAFSQPIRIRGGVEEQEYLKRIDCPVYEAHRTHRGPTLSGRLDDPVWAEATEAVLPYTVHSPETPPVATTFRSIITKRELYIGIHCEEPLMTEMNCVIDHDGNPALYYDESVEIFIDTGLTKTSHLQLMINADGYCYLAFYGRTMVGNLHPSVVTGKTDTGWAAEVAFSLEEISEGPEEPLEWGFNLFRNRQVERGNFVWSSTGRSAHSPWFYGVLKG